jgi:hypothetical protein
MHDKRTGRLVQGLGRVRAALGEGWVALTVVAIARAPFLDSAVLALNCVQLARTGSNLV